MLKSFKAEVVVMVRVVWRCLNATVEVLSEAARTLRRETDMYMWNPGC